MALGNCIDCYTGNRLARLAVLELEEDPLCRTHAKNRGLSDAEIADMTRKATPAEKSNGKHDEPAHVDMPTRPAAPGNGKQSGASGAALCACGCGEPATKGKYAWGHRKRALALVARADKHEGKICPGMGGTPCGTKLGAKNTSGVCPKHYAQQRYQAKPKGVANVRRRASREARDNVTAPEAQRGHFGHLRVNEEQLDRFLIGLAFETKLRMANDYLAGW